MNVNFVSPLVVTANQSNALDLEFDLAHPAFIVTHVPVTYRHNDVGGRFQRTGAPPSDPRHHTAGAASHVRQCDRGCLRQHFDHHQSRVPCRTAGQPRNSGSLLAEPADSCGFNQWNHLLRSGRKDRTTIQNFAAEASTIVGKNVRIAARYQSNGTLVAVRIWSSSTFNNVWVSPEGHVLHVNTSTDVITVQNELGAGVPLTVNSNTQFFFRTPWNATADATPIATGTGFLTSHNLVRGFKVHASVVDPLAGPAGGAVHRH